MDLTRRLESLYSQTDPNAMLYAFSDLVELIRESVNVLGVAKEDIVLNELKRIVTRVLTNYIKVGLDFESEKDAKSLLAKVDAVLESHMDDILQVAMRPTAFGLEAEKNAVKRSVYLEIIAQFSSTFGLENEPIAVPLLFAGGSEEERVKRILSMAELLEQKKKFYAE